MRTFTALSVLSALFVGSQAGNSQFLISDAPVQENNSIRTFAETTVNMLNATEPSTPNDSGDVSATNSQTYTSDGTTATSVSTITSYTSNNLTNSTSYTYTGAKYVVTLVNTTYDDTTGTTKVQTYVDDKISSTVDSTNTLSDKTWTMTAKTYDSTTTLTSTTVTKTTYDTNGWVTE